MRWRPVVFGLRRLAIGLVVLSSLLARGAAAAAEPTTAPLPRVEGSVHTATIWRIATDRAGRWAVTASDDKTARVWEVATGRLLTVLRPPQDVGNEGRLYAVAMSPDGQLVSVAGWTGWAWSGASSIYLFDRTSARLLRRIDRLPDVVQRLAWSPDGRWLAASLGRKGGIRLFDAASGAERGSDPAYSADTYSVHFSSDSRRLVSASFDGRLRAYTVDDRGGLQLQKSAALASGKKPYVARFSPDGRRIAVGFEDGGAIQVLDAQSFKDVAAPSMVGIDDGRLIAVAWSADGTSLLAGGRWDVAGQYPVRRWRVDDWSRYEDVLVAGNTLLDLAPLPAAAGGGWLYATFDSTWGVLDPSAQVVRRQAPAIADLRGQWEQMRVSADGRRLRFGYQLWGESPRIFDLVARALQPDGEAAAAGLRAADTVQLAVTDWKNRTDPKLDGKVLALEPYEEARSVAIAPDGRRFVLGTSWNLRLFDRGGVEIWNQPAPGAAWAVNITADGRFVVASYGDGTIRWYRLEGGSEVLAFFPHADRQRWIAWTPEGFYATSGPDADELIGYHLNQGQDREGRFVSARQLREKFYQPGLISRRLDANGDALLADAAARLGDVRTLLSADAAPAPTVELVSDATVTTERDVSVKVRLRQGGSGGRLIYRIDGVELEGRPAGVAGDGIDSRTFSLPPGRKQITVTAVDARGIESPPVRVAVEVRAPAAAPALHVLAVGITNYRDRELQKGVRFSADDARAVGRIFQERGQRFYRSVNVNVLTDERASAEGVREALRAVGRGVAVQDVFVLYMSGHGASFDREYHFIPWDAVYTSAAALRQRSLSHQDIRALLAAIPASKTLVLLDTCSSGGFGLQDGRATGQKDAIDRLTRLTGRATIAATEDEKMAIEGEGGHGAFTFALLEGLRGEADRDRNGMVEVRELADHIESRLPDITRRRWGYEQFPFSSTEGQSFTLLPRQ